MPWSWWTSACSPRQPQLATRCRTRRTRQPGNSHRRPRDQQPASRLAGECGQSAAGPDPGVHRHAGQRAQPGSRPGRTQRNSPRLPPATPPRSARPPHRLTEAPGYQLRREAWMRWCHHSANSAGREANGHGTAVRPARKFQDGRGDVGYFPHPQYGVRFARDVPDGGEESTVGVEAQRARWPEEPPGKLDWRSTGLQVP